jgi:SMI1 / KNR4 family (SUKH-1)
MPAQMIEELLKLALQKRSEKKAEEAVESLGRMARLKGKQHVPALEALRQAALECPHAWVRKDAFLQIGEAILPEDQASIDFLYEHLRDDESAYHCSCGLVRLKGQAVYADLIEIIADSNYSMDTRSSLLTVLSDHCKRPFDKAALGLFLHDLTEDHIPVAELEAWLAAGFPEPEPIVLPIKKLAKLGITLPDDYAKFLAEHRGEEYDFDDDQWELSTAEELLDTLDVDGQEQPAIRRLIVYADTLKDVMEDGETEDHKGKPYPLTRLAEGVAIGTNGSGDVIYLDPADQNAVWVFHPDGGDVERISKTFKSWLKQAEML